MITGKICYYGESEIIDLLKRYGMNNPVLDYDDEIYVEDGATEEEIIEAINNDDSTPLSELLSDILGETVIDVIQDINGAFPTVNSHDENVLGVIFEVK